MGQTIKYHKIYLIKDFYWALSAKRERDDDMTLKKCALAVGNEQKKRVVIERFKRGWKEIRTNEIKSHV